MTQVIVYQNPNGPNVCVTTPTGEVSIDQVLTNDCPLGAIIIDESELPQGNNDFFFDAWRLNGSIITVDIAAAQAYYLTVFNNIAKTSASTRALNTLTGIPNPIPDDQWLASVNASRAQISEATTTDALLAIPFPQP